MDSKLKLSVSERVFLSLTLSYSLLCFVFAFLLEKGREVVVLSANYSEKWNLFFSYVTQLAEWEGIVFFSAIILLMNKRHLLAFGISLLLETVIVQSTKFMLAQERPRAWAQLNHIPLPIQASELLHHSFPSGHTALVFCMAYCLVILINDWKWTVLLFVLALFVSFSRVYLMAHFVIDTGAGALIGCAAGFAGNYISRQLPINNRQ